MNENGLLTKIADDVAYLRGKVDDHGEAITEVRIHLTKIATERRMEIGAWRWVTTIGVPAIVSALIFVGGCIWRQN